MREGMEFHKAIIHLAGIVSSARSKIAILTHYRLSHRIAAMTRGSRWPYSTAITTIGLNSGA